MGISFLKQYAASGVDIPLTGPAFSFDQGILQAVGAAALGVVNTSQWNKDLDNAANKAFVKSFQEAYGRLPSLYASQGFDTANLIISALAKADAKMLVHFVMRYVLQILTVRVATLVSLVINTQYNPSCLLYTSPSPRDGLLSRMPSSA